MLQRYPFLAEGGLAGCRARDLLMSTHRSVVCHERRIDAARIASQFSFEKEPRAF
jgi:hypothetical protein